MFIAAALAPVIPAQVPTRHGYLARDQERALVVEVVDDLEEIAALLGGERLGSPVVDDQELRALEGRHQTREAPLATGPGPDRRRAGGALVEDGEAVNAVLAAGYNFRLLLRWLALLLHFVLAAFTRPSHASLTFAQP